MLVMIVDDSRSSLLQLQNLTMQAADVRTAVFTDPQAALAAASKQKYGVIIVDHIMPKMDGITLIRHLRALDHHDQIPIVMFTATTDVSVRLDALKAGATDFLSKSHDAIELKVKIRNLVRLAEAMQKVDDHVACLAREVEAATRSLLAREEEMIFRLSKAVEYRDNDTGDHTVRVARYSKLICEELGLPPDECRAIYLASPLHDLGKVAIPDSILLKPGRLDETETNTIRTHTQIGERILGDSTSDLMRLAAEIAGNHHERWDGQGYPRGLSGEAIPLCARIVAVADVFDALTTRRPYKQAMSFDEAMACLERERGRHFDPACLDAFVSAVTRERQTAPATSAA